MRVVVILLMLGLCSGCLTLSVTVNLGGTVNNISLDKSSDGDMTTGSWDAEESNTSTSDLRIPFK